MEPGADEVGLAVGGDAMVDTIAGSWVGGEIGPSIE